MPSTLMAYRKKDHRVILIELDELRTFFEILSMAYYKILSLHVILVVVIAHVKRLSQIWHREDR